MKCSEGSVCVCGRNGLWREKKRKTQRKKENGICCFMGRVKRRDNILLYSSCFFF